MSHAARDDTPPDVSAEWLAVLEESERDREAGRTVPASTIHAGLREAIERLEAARLAAPRR